MCVGSALDCYADRACVSCVGVRAGVGLGPGCLGCAGACVGCVGVRFVVGLRPGCLGCAGACVCCVGMHVVVGNYPGCLSCAGACVDVGLHSQWASAVCVGAVFD